MGIVKRGSESMNKSTEQPCLSTTVRNSNAISNFLYNNMASNWILCNVIHTIMNKATKAESDVCPEGKDFWASEILRELKSEVQLNSTM